MFAIDFNSHPFICLTIFETSTQIHTVGSLNHWYYFPIAGGGWFPRKPVLAFYVLISSLRKVPHLQNGEFSYTAIFQFSKCSSTRCCFLMSTFFQIDQTSCVRPSCRFWNIRCLYHGYQFPSKICFESNMFRSSNIHGFQLPFQNSMSVNSHSIQDSQPDDLPIFSNEQHLHAFTSN